MIVDDSKLARVSLKKKLEQRGLETVMAEGAREALDLLKTTPVDVIFMDHLMPDIDGFQATRQIRANAATSHLPIIMCSGKENDGYLQEARAIGATNILSKPPEDATLDAILAELERSALRVDTATPQPVATAANEDARAPAGQARTDELSAMISPLSAQVTALTDQLDAFSRDIEARLAEADKLTRLFEENPPASRFYQAVAAQIDDKLAALTLPSAAQIEQSVKTGLLEELRSGLSTELAASAESAVAQGLASWRSTQATATDALGKQLQSALAEQLREAKASLRESLESAVDERATALLAQRLDGLRAELRAGLAPPRAATPELAVLRKSLYEDIMAELSLREAAAQTAAPDADTDAQAAAIERLQASLAAERERADRLAGRVSGCLWLAALSSATAAAAVLLHWIL